MKRCLRVGRGGVVVLTLLAIVVAAGVALCQAQIRPPLQTVRVMERAIQLPPARLAQVTQGKQVADLARLQQTYGVKNNIPFIRVGTDEFLLLPLSEMEFDPTPAQIAPTQMLAGPLTIHREWIAGATVRPPTLPTVVDRRAEQTSVKNQGSRGTCVCFASLAALEVAYGGGALDLSENYANYLYMRAEGRGCKSDGLQTHMAAEYLTANGVCQESVCPYQTSFPAFCNNGASPDPTQRNSARTGSFYRMKSYQKIWRNDDLTSDTGLWINNPRYLEAILRSGKDIVFGTHVAGWSGDLTGILDVKLGTDGKPLPSRGGHAMVIVGYDRPQEYFIVKNSWGTAKGQAGYLYLSYDYIRTYAKYGYVINEVEPLAIGPMRAYRLTPRLSD